jgi:hypothetical protein
MNSDGLLALEAQAGKQRPSFAGAGNETKKQLATDPTQL